MINIIFLLVQNIFYITLIQSEYAYTLIVLVEMN